MGDIGTHGTIAEKVMDLLKRKGPKDSNGQPRENYWFFELGNFLTDLSQLRDPPAHVGGKIAAWKVARKEHWEWTLKNIACLDDYLEALMGDGSTHGLLAEFLKNFAFFWGCTTFRRKNPPISSKDFERIFKYIQGEKYYKGYTQYWAHEHLDLPPPEPYEKAVQRRPLSRVERHYCTTKPDGKNGDGDDGETEVPSLSLAGAHYEFNKVFILPSAKSDLTQLYQLKQKHADRHLAIFGHTDAKGKPHYNNVLSKLRAEAAHALMIRDVSWWDDRFNGASLSNEKSWGTREIQHMLKALGHYKLIVDGDFKGGTLQAVQDFQASVGMSKTHQKQVDSTTRQRLIEKYMDHLFPGRLAPKDFFQDSSNKPAIFGCGEAYLAVKTDKKNPQNRRVIFVLRHKEGAPVDLSKLGKEVPFEAWLAPESQKVSSGAKKTPPKKKPPPAKRKLPQYLDEQIEFCSELLTAVEHDWHRLTNLPDSPANRNDRNSIIALFGHVCHVVEDFYFHSNFIDKAWVRFSKPLPGPDNTTRNNRVWKRRLRDAMGMNDNKDLSNTDSYVVDLVLTGGFGGQDIFFTLKDALKTFTLKHGDVTEEFWYQMLPPVAQRVFKPYFNEPLRRRIYEKKPDDNKEFKNVDLRKQWFEDVREFVNKDKYLKGIPDPRRVKALREMCRLDKEAYEISTKLVNIPDICGCFAFLLEMLCQADLVVDESDSQSTYLDNLEALSPEYVTKNLKPTNNGAARENIGTHSLINKDNKLKGPLFPQAFNLAVHVSCYIAEVMVRQVTRKVAVARFHRDAPGATNTIKTPPNVDWLHLLRHFLCHPDECENNWHVEAMQDPRAPTHHIIKAVDNATKNKRLKMKMRDKLKKQYQDYGSKAEKKWKDVRDN